MNNITIWREVNFDRPWKSERVVHFLVWAEIRFRLQKICLDVLMFYWIVMLSKCPKFQKNFTEGNARKIVLKSNWSCWRNKSCIRHNHYLRMRANYNAWTTRNACDFKLAFLVIFTFRFWLKYVKQIFFTYLRWK